MAIGESRNGLVNVVCADSENTWSCSAQLHSHKNVVQLASIKLQTPLRPDELGQFFHAGNHRLSDAQGVFGGCRTKVPCNPLAEGFDGDFVTGNLFVVSGYPSTDSGDCLFMKRWPYFVEILVNAVATLSSCRRDFRE